jgi:hypothetical protein
MPGSDDDKGYGRFEQSYFAAAAETIGTELVIKPYVYSCRRGLATVLLEH